MIAVMGATGNTGGKVTEALLRAGESVRALGRSKRRLAELANAGAEVRSGELTDVEFLSSAFRGADAVYTLLPTDRRAPEYARRMREEGEAIVEAIRKSGVPFVVALSSLGAELSEGTGLITGLHAQEERLGALRGTNVLRLRPVSFFENFYDALPLVKHQGILADSVASDLAVPMIASRAFEGVFVRELLGPREYTHAEIARILGEHVGVPELRYVQLPYDEMARALVEAGLSESFAGLYVDMTRAFNEGRVQPRDGRKPANTTETKFEDFAPELARAYRAA